MDLKEYRKNVQLELKADSIRKNFLEEKRDIENTKRGYVEELEDKYKPLIAAQKDINKKQNMIMRAVVKQIMDNNQQAIRPLVEEPAAEGLLVEGPLVEEPDEEEPLVEEPDEEEPLVEEPDGKLFYAHDINDGINPATIKTLGFSSMEKIMKMSPEEIEVVVGDVGDYKKTRGVAVRVAEKNHGKEAADVLRAESKMVSVYRDKLNARKRELEKNKTGKGIKKYKQTPHHAYKIQNNKYGQLMIDTDKLFNNMKLEAYKRGSLVYEQMVDRSLIDLITKRFNPKTKYSALAKQVFHDLNILSEIPKHIPSRKYKIGKGITYYHGPDKLVDRLTVLTGVRAAGNYNIEMRNEIVEILDELLKTGEIDKETYNDYSNKYYLNPT